MNRIVLLLFLSLTAYSQDTLFLKGAKRNAVSILEINDNGVRYTKMSNVNGSEYLLPITALDSIKYSDGRIIRFIESINKPDTASDNSDLCEIKRKVESYYCHGQELNTNDIILLGRQLNTRIKNKDLSLALNKTESTDQLYKACAYVGIPFIASVVPLFLGVLASQVLMQKITPDYWVGFGSAFATGIVIEFVGLSQKTKRDEWRKKTVKIYNENR